MRLLFAIFLFSSIAKADCTSPAGKVGQIQFIAGEMKFCDDLRWVGTSQGVAAPNCPIAGAMEYHSGSQNFRYCAANNGNWINMSAAVVGSSGTAAAGTVIYDHDLHKLKMSNGTNWYKIANQSWSIEPAPDFGGYKEADYSEPCLMTDTITITGATETIEITIEGSATLYRSELSEAMISTGTISFVVNGVIQPPITPYDEYFTDFANPEYSNYYGTINVDPNDTLAIEYCGYYRLNEFNEPDWDGSMYLDIYNTGVSTADYLGSSEIIISGGYE